MNNRVSDVLNAARKKGRSFLLEPEARRVCLEYGIPIPSFGLASNANEAVSKARELGLPAVLKVVSPDILHKSDVGGVLVGLKSLKEVKEGFETVLRNVKRHNPAANIEGLLVQKMVPAGFEVIVGAMRDPEFGPTVMFGLGGVHAEVFEDVSFGVVPVDENDANEMVTSIRGYRLLEGHRNAPGVDKGAIVSTILKVSKLVKEQKEIDQLDLNPLMAYQAGVTAVDARIVLSSQISSPEREHTHIGGRQ